MKIKAIIVDDESAARNMLRQVLAEHCPVVELIGEATNVKDAVKLILKEQVELVFLDIEMPEENGFALFEYFAQPSFETIFCTAYSEYAIRAFEVSAVSYLLKPLNIKALQLAVEKAIKQHGQNQIIARIGLLRENLQVQQLQKIALPLSDSLMFVDVEDIFYFEADGSYTNVYTPKGKVLVSRKLKTFEDILTDDARFFRTHRSYFVNIENIKKYTKKDGATLLFGNNTEVPVAREKVKEFDEFITGLKLWEY